MRISKKEVVTVHQALSYISNMHTTAWYGITKNLNKTKRHFEDYQEMVKSIQENLAEKDEAGKPKVDKNGYVIFGDNTEEADKVLDDYLSEEVELEFHNIKAEDIKVKDASGNMVQADLPASLMMQLINTVVID